MLLSLAAPSDQGEPWVSSTWFEQVTRSTAAQVRDLSPEKTTQVIRWDGRSIEVPKDEWIVQLTNSAVKQVSSPSAAARLFRNGGLSFEIVRGLGGAGQLLLRIPGATAEAVKHWLGRHPAVDTFGPNGIVQATQTPNDPYFPSLWGLQNRGQENGKVGADIKATDAWDLTTGSQSIVVGVIDSGIDYTHPDLYLNIWINQGEIPSALRSSLVDTTGNGLITFHDLNHPRNSAFVSDYNGNGYIDAGDLLRDPRWVNGRDNDGNGFRDDLVGWNFVSGTNDPADDHGHGTHVAGTIGATGNNAVGITGVNWDVLLMPLRFLRLTDDGRASGTTEAAIQAINYATSMRSNHGTNVRVTNNSWGGGGHSEALSRAIRTSGNAEILFVASAGNDTRNNDQHPAYPASYNLANIISVAATDRRDNLASFSNYGPTSVHLAAPGVDIRSTMPGRSYAYMHGTSMAAPHVAGVAALAWSLDAQASVKKVRDAILNGVDLIASLSGKTATGGRLNARRTLEQMLPALSINDVSVKEGNSGTTHAVFTVQLLATSSEPVTVKYATSDGTASAGSDYVATSGTLSFAPGETIKTIAVPIIGDTIDEPNETFYVDLFDAKHAPIVRSRGVGTIEDDDPPPSLSIDDVSVVEGHSSAPYAVFTVRLSEQSGKTVTVSYSTANGTARAGQDYKAVNGTLSFAPGETIKTIAVPIIDDALDEYDETFFVNLRNASNATIVQGRGVGTILDNDPPPYLTIGNAGIKEGNSGTKDLRFTVQLSEKSGKTVTVKYATANGAGPGAGGALAGLDYIATSGTLTFKPGETTKSITVKIIGDTIYETDESFLVQLSEAQDTWIMNSHGVGTIVNDDSPPPLGLERVHRFGSTGEDMGRAVATDAQGNVYLVGTFQGTVDFDPGPGVFELTSGNGHGAFLVKLDPAGRFVWASHLTGQKSALEGVVVDASGNVYASGWFQGTVDFDPGPGRHELTSPISAFVWKLDTHGQLDWVRHLEGRPSSTSGAAYSSRSSGIVLDASGNVYTAGLFTGMADFNPGPGTHWLTASSDSRAAMYVWKLDTQGRLVWARRMAASTQLEVSGIAVDRWNNVYTTGSFAGRADFNPGSSTHNMTSAGGTDSFVVKLNSSGNFAWSRQLSGSLSNQTRALAVDGSGNVYLTGSFQGTATFGTTWRRILNTLVRVSVKLTSTGGDDAFAWKLNSSGDLLWARQLGGSGSDAGHGLVLDRSDNVYITGAFSNTVDFNPGSGSYRLASTAGRDGFLWKLNQNGNFLNAYQMRGEGDVVGQGVALDREGHVFTTGYFSGWATFDYLPSWYDMPSRGGFDAFLVKHGPFQNSMLQATSTSAASSPQATSALSADLGAVPSSNPSPLATQWNAPQDLARGVDAALADLALMLYSDLFEIEQLESPTSKSSLAQ